MPSDAPQLPMVGGSIGERWHEQRRRRRILYGRWHPDLVRRAKKLIGSERRRAWGYLDQSANPFRQLADQFSTLYDHEPNLRNEKANDKQQDALEEALNEAGYWALMQRVQRDTVGIRECYLRIDVTDDGELVLEQVFPDMVSGERFDRTGRRLQRFAYLRPRADPGAENKVAWFWDVFEVVGGVGTYSVRRFDKKEMEGDAVSDLFLMTSSGGDAPAGGLTGNEYPYLDGEREAFIPVVRHRAAVLGSSTHYDPFDWHEVVEGSLNVAVYWSFWGHVLRQAGWPQRYSIGCHIKGTGIVGEDRREQVEADPAILLHFTADGKFEGTPSVGQFAPGADALQLAGGIERYEARIAAGVGVSPSDLVRTSGDPRSGYALAVSREAQREQQRKLTPAFRQGDRQALQIIAILLNQAQIEDLPELPEKGWTPKYVSLPMSADERRAVIEEALKLLDEGFIDEVEAMQMISGHTMSRAEAKAKLERLKVEKEKRDADKPKPPAPPPGPAPDDDPDNPAEPE